ncbi:DUF4209 domain-containing protein [Amycolatopsis cihanbeyliensis]|uniref:Uncharacterized protein DUF4209 n=1 Tax=Amycolatopsis cihanbeyliensis TaxID=1128664 RepID=A0A542DET4_AMYCI|nr:DUF4209 domain-containing protein [Amycolatopsis cihanbeyliensis]TQJ01582.1 uncharacterized protein DUF4209 [Amycolatopsis cihanbeyliensis]
MNTAEPADALPPNESARPESPRAPYRHEAAHIPALARLADAACEDVGDPLDASVRVGQLAEQMAPAAERPDARVVALAFSYVLRHREIPQGGADLGPLDGPSLYPTAMREVSEEIRATWLALAGEVTQPVARSRLYDIVFTLRLMQNSRQAAERAARAYLDGIGGHQRAQVRADGVVRAWTLARLVSSSELEREIVESMIDLVSDLLDRDEHPYAVIPLLSALIAPPRRKVAEAADSRIDVLLDRALVSYPETHVIKDVAVIVRKRAGSDAARVDVANRVLINAMLAEARSATDPMVIRTLFNNAASQARELGVADLEQAAIAGLQSAPVLTWESTRYEISLPPSFFDFYLPGFDAAADWREALTIWCHTDSPAGRYEVNLDTTHQVQQASVFRYLATTVVFRDGDMPARTLSDEDEVFARDLARTETQYMGTYGLFLGNALFMTASRFGIPSQDDLKAFLSIPGCSAELVDTLARGMQLFWVAEYDAATHLVIPKIEAAVRALLLELNEPVYRAAVGDSAGQFAGLGSLLEPLVDNGFDPDWERFLRTLLLGHGLNLRNLVAHGFVHDVNAVNAALALRALAMLTLITSDAAARRDTATVRAALANPANPRPHRRWWQRIAAAITAARHEYHRD